MTDEHNLSPAELEKRVRERKWEQVQIKGLTAWLNSYLNKASLNPVATLPDDLMDGVKLLQCIELITKDKQEKGLSPRDPFPKYIENPRSRIQKIENASKALKFITENLHVKLVGIGAEDIVDGNLRLVLGLLWSSFRTLSLGSLSNRMGKGERDSRPEDDLLKWIASMTEGYGVEVTSFKTSFNDGRVWAALVDRFDPTYIDFPALNKADKEGTLNLVFEIAEKKLGIPRLFEPSDLLEGNPDERSVILYSSLFYHAWTSNEERIKLANESRGLGNKMSEYKSKLEAEEEERLRLQRERDALKEEASNREKALSSEEERIRQLEAAIKELLAAKEDIKSRLGKEIEYRKTKFAEDVKKMGSETEHLKKELSDEKRKAEEAAKANATLLAENNALAEKVKNMNKLVGGLAGGDDFGNLAGLLREHVAALHLEMKRLEETEKEDGEKAAINADHAAATQLVEDSMKELHGQSEEKAKEKLGELLQGTSNTLIRIFKVADAQNELHEVVDKKGALLAQVEGKRWKKRWFVLRGFFLYYYNKKEDQEDLAGAEGQISLETSTVAVLNQDVKPNWAMKLTIANTDQRSSREELLIGTKTKEERDDWLFLLRGKILYLQYLALMESSHSRPDLRVVNLFSVRNVGTLHLEGVKITVPVLKILCGVLEDHEETERISLVDADLDDDGISVLSSVLERMRGLLSLNFARNRLTSSGVKTLVKSLHQHVLLQEIDLSHNEIDDDGVRVLCELLEKNPDLDTVDLSHNHITGEDEKTFHSLAKVFSSLKLLTALKFRHNRLGDAAMAELAKVVATHPGIVEILLGKNHIGDAGAKELFNALHENQCVQKIDVSHNRIGTKGVEALKDLLAANKNIHSVDVSNNDSVIVLAGFSELKDVDFHDLVVHSV